MATVCMSACPFSVAGHHNPYGQQYIDNTVLCAAGTTGLGYVINAVCQEMQAAKGKNVRFTSQFTWFCVYMA